MDSFDPLSLSVRWIPGPQGLALRSPARPGQVRGLRARGSDPCSRGYPTLQGKLRTPSLRVSHQFYPGADDKPGDRPVDGGGESRESPAVRVRVRACGPRLLKGGVGGEAATSLGEQKHR